MGKRGKRFLFAPTREDVDKMLRIMFYCPKCGRSIFNSRCEKHKLKSDVARRMYRDHLAVRIPAKVGFRRAEVVGQTPAEALCRCRECYGPRAILDENGQPILNHHRPVMPGLRVADIDWDRRRIKTKGKGWGSGSVSETEVRVDVGTLQVLRYYIDRNKLKPQDRIIPLTTRQYNRLIRQIAQKAQVPNADHMTPHSLRRFFGTEVIRRTKSIEHARRLLRHTDIDTTIIYLKLDETDLDKAYDQTFGTPDSEDGLFNEEETIPR